MRLLRTEWLDFHLETFHDDRTAPPYAILSHTWLDHEEEVLFQDLNNIRQAQRKLGWRKLVYAVNEAARDGFAYVWIDTCCIDKESSAELAEAINSMFRWYQRAAVCYVYLSDMPLPRAFGRHPLHGEIHIDHPERNQMAVISSELRSVAQSIKANSLPNESPGTSLSSHEPEEGDLGTIKSLFNKPPIITSKDVPSQYSDRSIEMQPVTAREAPASLPLGFSLDDWERFSRCRWFTRGWTLQEILAPRRVVFFSASWVDIGTLQSLSESVAAVTGIHSHALNGTRHLSSFSIAQKMCWAALRETTRVEDHSYSLLGIFGVNLPIIYGEGERAFMRLQEELLRVSSDHTIFAWSMNDACWKTGRQTSYGSRSDLLAPSARAFKSSGRLICTNAFRSRRTLEVSAKAVTFSLPVVEDKIDRTTVKAILNCNFEDDDSREVVIILQRNEDPNMYEVAGDIAFPRIEALDTYMLSMAPVRELRFSILRYAALEEEFVERKRASHQIMCRIIAKRFNRKKFTDYTVTAHERLRGGRWDSSSESFHMTCSCMISGRLCEMSFEGGVHIWGDNSRQGTLKILTGFRNSRLRTDMNILDGWAAPHLEFETPSHSMPTVGRLLSTYSPGTAILKDGRVARAAYRSKPFVHKQVDLVEIHVSPLFVAIIGCTAEILHAFIKKKRSDAKASRVDNFQRPRGPMFAMPGVDYWILAPVALLFYAASLVIPILTISSSQTRAEHSIGSGTSAELDPELSWALKTGLPLTLPILILASFKNDTIFPRSTVRYNPRMLLFVAVVSLNIAICTLSIILSRLVEQNLDILSADLWQQAYAYGLYASSKKWTVVTATFAIVSSFGFLLYLQLARYLGWKTIGGKTAILSAMFRIVTIPPFVMLSRLTYLTPWKEEDCRNGLVTGSAKNFYIEVANANGQSYQQVCTSFAFQGKLILAIMSLSVWDVIVDILVAICCACLVLRLNMLPRQKWSVF